jgi:excisionase family DNA binding protein
MAAAIEQTYTVQDAAKALRVNPATIRHWLKTGRLKGVKMGRRWRIRESDLEVFLPPAASL